MPLRCGGLPEDLQRQVAISDLTDVKLETPVRYRRPNLVIEVYQEPVLT
jgi:hypothetical protein